MGTGAITDVHAETKIIPSISVSERYDTNVWLAPSEFIPNRTMWDFSTSVSPELQVLSETRQAQTSVKAGFSGVTFVNNPDLSFVSTNVEASSNLDGWIGRLIPGAKLYLADNFRFTPEPPAFLSGVGEGSDAFSRGIQAYRANTYANTASATAGYELSRILSMHGNYSFSMFRIGSFFAISPTETGVPISFFDTNVHRFRVGPKLRLTRTDAVSLNYQRTFMTFQGGGLSRSVTAESIEAEYSKKVSSWTASFSGGMTVVDQGSSFPSGKAMLKWKVDRSTNLSISASRAIAPAFFGGASGVVSSVGALSLERRLHKRLTLAVNANYAYNEPIPVRFFTYESLNGNALLTYRLTRTYSAMLSYDYTSFSIKGGGLPPYLVDRQAVTFAISASWK